MKPVTIGSVSFKSKKDAIEHIRGILHRYKDGETVREDQFLRDLLAMHREAVQKIGVGISHFTVSRDPEWGTTRHFVAVRLDGSSTDFSFDKCLTGRDEEGDVLGAMRDAVKDQVLAFKESEFAAGDVLCPYTGEKLSWGGCHVEHYPVDFDELARRWLAENKPVAISDTADGEVRRQMTHEGQRKSWQDFHARNAGLRIASVRGNLSNAKIGKRRRRR